MEQTEQDREADNRGKRKTAVGGQEEAEGDGEDGFRENPGGWQAKGAKPAGKAESVQQSKGEGDDPWMQDGNARLAIPGTDDLDTENQDRQRDSGIEQRPWQMRITRTSPIQG